MNFIKITDVSGFTGTKTIINVDHIVNVVEDNKNKELVIYMNSNSNHVCRVKMSLEMFQGLINVAGGNIIES